MHENVWKCGRKYGCLLALLVAGGCASPTHPVDPYPANQDPRHNTYAYQAADGGVAPAGPDDAMVAAGAAAVDSALGIGARPEIRPAHDEIRGYCEMDVKPPVGCAFMGVILKGVDGTPVSQSRTDGGGNFVFKVQPGEKYYLGAGSSEFFTIFKPEPPFTGGSIVRMRLHSKH